MQWRWLMVSHDLRRTGKPRREPIAGRSSRDYFPPHGAVRRNRIVESAWLLAAANGYDGLQMRAVAAHAAVSTTTIYRWFPSKVHLLLAVLERWLERLDTQLSSEARTVEGRHRRLQRVIEALYGSLHQAPRLGSAMARAFLLAQTQAYGPSAEIRTRIYELFLAGFDPAAPTRRDRQISELLTDILVSDLIALAQDRSTAIARCERLAQTYRLLDSHP